jgi:hypothetical protein
MAKKPQITPTADLSSQDPKTGTALVEQTGTTQPATGTAAAAADAAGDQTLAADAAAAGPRKGPSGYTVVVTASQPVRWRIGRQFGREPVSIAADELTEAEAVALAEDPLLTVTIIDAPY